MVAKLLSLILLFNLSNAWPFEVKQRQIILLPTKYGPAKILLESTKVAIADSKSTRNCYAVSTMIPSRSPGGKQVPGDIKNSPVKFPHMVNMESLLLAIGQDGGIYLGEDPQDSTAEFDLDKNYYLVASMISKNEYHFVRAYADGWWSKPSKVGVGFNMTEKFRMPTKGLWGILLRQNTSYSFKPVGYFLFPTY